MECGQALVLLRRERSPGPGWTQSRRRVRLVVRTRVRPVPPPVSGAHSSPTIHPFCDRMEQCPTQTREYPTTGQAAAASGADSTLQERPVFRRLGR
jgi:hypothetical protein